MLFNNMIDEFLQDKKDEIWAEGTLVQKGTRSTILVKKGQDPKVGGVMSCLVLANLCADLMYSTLYGTE